MTSKWFAWTPQGEPAKPAKPSPFTLEGHAVEFESQGERCFLVADDADAQRLIARHGASLGETWTVAELNLIATVPSQADRAEIARWKRTFNGTLRPDLVRKVQSRKEQTR
jgi:hypothetical protein